jgi:hypothetical protein
MNAPLFMISAVALPLASSSRAWQIKARAGRAEREKRRRRARGYRSGRSAGSARERERVRKKIEAEAERWREAPAKEPPRSAGVVSIEGASPSHSAPPPAGLSFAVAGAHDDGGSVAHRLRAATTSPRPHGGAFLLWCRRVMMIARVRPLALRGHDADARARAAPSRASDRRWINDGVSQTLAATFLTAAAEAGWARSWSALALSRYSSISRSRPSLRRGEGR